jgi:WhiB family redox-sensing transcriptional regulator
VAIVVTREGAGGRTSAWQLEAACRQLPTELFFPVGHGPEAEAQTRLAKEICRSCPVRSECLDYAMAANLRYGVFGGLAEDERREVRRRQRRRFPVLQMGLEASA